jgi:MYXO-CTERM domain-containing protein
MNPSNTVLTVIAVVGLTASANADLLYTFNTDVEGFQNVSWQAASPVGGPGVPTVQQTHTASGWQMLLTKEFAWGAGGGSANQQLEMQALANQGANAHLAFDVMVDGASFSPGAGTWYQFNVVGNSDGAAGWSQTENLFPVPGNWHNADDATLIAMHVDLTFAQMGWQPGDTWFQLYTGANSSASPVNFYLDNVTAYAVVPEPSLFALAGLGAAVLLIRRRK